MSSVGILRLSCVLLLAAPCTAPTAPLVALERRRAEFLFQTATFLSATAGSAAFWWHSGHVLANGEAWEQEAMDLIVTAATEPLMRRLVFVPGELRFTFARLHSLFDDGTPAVTDCLANAFQATRFRVEDLPRLLVGLRIPETFVAGGHRFLGEEGLLILLVRLAFPGRNSELAAAAGRWPSATSVCFNFMMQLIYDQVHAARRTPHAARHNLGTHSATVLVSRSLLACAIGGASLSGLTTSHASQLLSMLPAARCATSSVSSMASCSMWPGLAGTRHVSRRVSGVALRGVWRTFHSPTYSRTAYLLTYLLTSRHTGSALLGQRPSARPEMAGHHVAKRDHAFPVWPDLRV